MLLNRYRVPVASVSIRGTPCYALEEGMGTTQENYGHIGETLVPRELEEQGRLEPCGRIFKRSTNT